MFRVHVIIFTMEQVRMLCHCSMPVFIMYFCAQLMYVASGWWWWVVKVNTTFLYSQCTLHTIAIPETIFQVRGATGPEEGNQMACNVVYCSEKVQRTTIQFVRERKALYCYQEYLLTFLYSAVYPAYNSYPTDHFPGKGSYWAGRRKDSEMRCQNTAANGRLLPEFTNVH